MTKFLTFIVDRTLANAPTDLKEYVIGVEVFDRDVTFDPRLDPIVRVEARRLRAKLQDYYEQQPTKGLVRLEIPAGGYLAKFSFVEKGSNDLSVTNRWQGVNRYLAVLPLINLGTDMADDFFASKLSRRFC